MKKISIILSVIALIFFSACDCKKGKGKDNECTDEKENKEVVEDNDNNKKTNNMNTIEKYIEENNIVAEPTETGLYYIVKEEGTGAQPDSGKMVKVHYTGTLLDGTKFDSSYDRGEPIEFTLGVGQVIRGWDEGISLMKVGEKATLLIPSELAYGNREVGGVIPANSPLLFEVELVEVK